MYGVKKSRWEEGQSELCLSIRSLVREHQSTLLNNSRIGKHTLLKHTTNIVLHSSRIGNYYKQASTSILSCWKWFGALRWCLKSFLFIVNNKYSRGKTNFTFCYRFMWCVHVPTPVPKCATVAAHLGEHLRETSSSKHVCAAERIAFIYWLQKAKTSFAEDVLLQNMILLFLWAFYCFLPWLWTKTQR